MKKIFILLVGLLSLAGCMKIEGPFFNNEGEEIPFNLDWKSFTFTSLTGGEDLVVLRDDQKGPFAISVPKYKESHSLTVVAYKTDCEVCKAQAPYLEKLAEEFSKFYSLDFVVIFLDVFESSDAQEAQWIKETPHLDAYANVAIACTGGACQKVFLPSLHKELELATVYYIDKADVNKERKGMTWNLQDDPDKLYDKMRTEAARILGLTPIAFDGSVSDFGGNIQRDVNL